MYIIESSVGFSINPKIKMKISKRIKLKAIVMWRENERQKLFQVWIIDVDIGYVILCSRLFYHAVVFFPSVHATEIALKLTVADNFFWGNIRNCDWNGITTKIDNLWAFVTIFFVGFYVVTCEQNDIYFFSHTLYRIKTKKNRTFENPSFNSWSIIRLSISIFSHVILTLHSETIGKNLDSQLYGCTLRFAGVCYWFPFFPFRL